MSMSLKKEFTKFIGVLQKHIERKDFCDNIINSPKGGMGMNGGIHDAWCLAQKLIAIKNGSAIDVLDEYERQRRPIAVEDIGGQSHKNRARMMSISSAERLKHLQKLQEISESYEKSRQFLLKSSMIEGLKRSETLI